ncbi:hypothetical protein JCM10908_003040 [Rhodotorula pacifica]|uniref:uncharacterized protein n=1 Tax=Rhodotorula pacifica TaxID=1495444 RepID=UPI00317016C8
MAAQTYLCYGIAVTNESLTYATMAYENLDGPVRFIQLVQNRIRQGALHCAGGSIASMLPIEIWDEIRHRVVDAELAVAERDFAIKHACWDCTQTWACGYQTWPDMLECDNCFDNMCDNDGFEDPELLKRCRYMLKAYGLDLPSSTLLQTPDGTCNWRIAGDPKAIAFVALSSATTEGINSSDHPSYEEPPVSDMDQFTNDGIWNVSLDIPTNADERFRRLLRDLHLQPLQVDDGTIGVTRAIDSNRKRTFRMISTGEAKPRWQLFTTVVCEW